MNIQAIVIDNYTVANVLKELHDPVLDGSVPSVAQYINAAALARKVIDMALGQSANDIDREDASDYEGALVHWRQLVSTQ